MRKYNNLSNGYSDGVVIFYMRKGKLHPILLTEEQADILDFVIPMPFKEDRMHISPDSVQLKAIEHMIDK